jgi:hypothetical protein
MTSKADEGPLPRWLFAVMAAVVAAGVAQAWALWWLSDDCFISFRYARNLIEGHGLVFNPGERVEGYSNPLWTLWIAAGMALGASPEGWSNGWGIVAYAAALGGLLRAHVELRAGRPAALVPLAALLGLAHREWAVFATSGLETSAFTACVAAAIVALGPRRLTLGRVAGAGVALGLAATLRHEGVLLVGVACLTLLRDRARAPVALVTLVATFLICWAPMTLWRIHYYGDFFPNTYYAKSGDRAWWSQGIVYLALYLERYWVTALAPVAAVVALGVARRRRPEGEVGLSDLESWALVASAFGIVYALQVTRVGGDFMYARFLVPIMPAVCILFEVAATSAGEALGAAPAAVVAVALGGLQAVTPSPVTERPRPDGIVDERAYYSPERVDEWEHDARVVAPFVAGLPLRVAIFGTEARFAYRARLPIVIEAMAGLTDPYTAHLELRERGVVGHEKHAPLEYLIGERQVHIVFTRTAEAFGLDAYIPRVLVRLDTYTARLLHWDPSMVRALQARGALVQNFPRMLDQLIARLDDLPRPVVEAEYARAEHFYFAFVRDPQRRAPFEKRLAH